MGVMAEIQDPKTSRLVAWTVRDLIRELTKQPLDATVLMSSDEEGNGFGRLCGVESGMRFAQMTYEVEVYEADDPAPNKAKPCIVLWPM